MKAPGVERQSKVRQDDTVVDVVTLQINYDRLWVHVRIIYVLLTVLTACYLAAAFTVLGANRQLSTCPKTAPLAPRVSWQNLSGLEDGMTESGEHSLVVERRRRSTSRRRRLRDDGGGQGRRAHRLTRRLRSSDTGGPSSSPWISRDEPTHDGLWMTMHSKIPVTLCCYMFPSTINTTR